MSDLDLHAMCVTVTDSQYPCAGVVQCTCSLDAFDEILVTVLRFETRTGLDINIIRKKSLLECCHMIWSI